MLKPALIDPIVKIALREDVGSKDITSSSVLPKGLLIKAEIEVQEKGILCGIEVAERVFRLVDENLRFLPVGADGESVDKTREVAYVEGSAVSILIAERTAINFLSHLSGIATLTRQFVDRVKGTRAKIMDTRKTTPGLRFLEKYAVKTGGGVNQRMGLYDQILIKDNHLRILRKEAIPDIVDRARRGALKKTTIGVEVKNLKELAEALKSGADYILLDNMTPAAVKEGVAMRDKRGGKIELEASGGITLENVRDYAEAGVERISVGRLTHAAPALNISLDIVG